MIALYGHGYVGQHIHIELVKQNITHVWLSHTEDAPADVKTVINAAGVTGIPNVDACESDKQRTVEGNVLFPYLLEQKYKNIPVIHISSGCVYTGYKDGGYTEDDPINFNFDNGSFYSGTKGLEQLILSPFMNKSYLLRIRMPFGGDHNDKNYLTKLIKYNKLIDNRNSLSSVEDVAKVAVYFATHKPTPGVYNVCNPGSTTTKDVANLLGLTKEWYTEDEFKSAVKAPRSNCVLNTDKLLKVYPMPTVDEALSKAIARLK